MAVVCIACTIGDDVVELPNMLELKKHEMLGHPRPEKILPVDPRGDHPSATELKAQKEKPTKPQVDKPTEEVKPIPLSLQYQWTGQCEKCRDTVKTIEVEVGSKLIVIAYCVRDNVKLAQEEVLPINKQKTEDTFENRIKSKK